jgi:hypothetical protein
LYFQDAGFEDVVAQPFGKSMGNFEVIDHPARESESLYVEGKKPD